MDHQLRAEIVGEADYWLGLSALFFECFGIEEEPGPSWFVVNMLLKYADDTFSVGSAAQALVNSRVSRSKAQYDATMCAKHLHSKGLVTLPEGVDISKRVFPSNTILSIGPEMNVAVERYIGSLLRGLFNLNVARQLKDTPRSVMVKTYAFMIDTYVAAWEKFLHQIACIAVENTTGIEDPIERRLRGNSEFFVILLKLWQARLNEADKSGFSVEQITAMHPRVLVAESDGVLEHVAFLDGNGIVENVSETKVPRYALAKRFSPAFDAYAPIFVKMRTALRSHLQGKFPSFGMTHSSDESSDRASTSLF